jgi:nucleotide-binding universal stress UspA family protein
VIPCGCIISGIDLGPDSEKNIAYAAYFASKTGATVSMVYVLDYLLTPPAYLTAYIEEEKRKEEAEMARLQAVLELLAVRAESRVVLGRLHESLVKVIHETAAELLVIGYKSHLLRPSSSERLIRSLAMPMLVVRGVKADHASPGNVQIRKILCPVDFSDNSGKALAMAKGYAGLFSAELHLMHVVPSHMIRERWERWTGTPEEDREHFEEGLRAGAGNKLADVMRQYDLHQTGEVVQGSPGEMICSVAGKGQYDMIVMGARGLTYLQGILVGSTTESVLKASDCPVLVVH